MMKMMPSSQQDRTILVNDNIAFQSKIGHLASREDRFDR